MVFLNPKQAYSLKSEIVLTGCSADHQMHKNVYLGFHFQILVFNPSEISLQLWDAGDPTELHGESTATESTARQETWFQSLVGRWS